MKAADNNLREWKITKKKEKRLKKEEVGLDGRNWKWEKEACVPE